MFSYQDLHTLMSMVPLPSGDMDPQLRKVIAAAATGNHQVLLACPPKVGGTFIRTALVHLLSRHYRSSLSRGSYANIDSARDPYFPTILNQHIVQSTPPVASVMHLHLFPARHVISMIEAFEIPVVICTRDILDALVSGLDMLEAAERKGEPIDDALIRTGKPFLAMDARERRHALVTHVTLWYARFYGQWLDYARECLEGGKPRPLWVRYRDLAERPQALLETIAGHVDPAHSYSHDEIAAVLAETMGNRDAARLNQGISGRGARFFTDDEKARIYAVMKTAGADDLVALGVLTDG